MNIEIERKFLIRLPDTALLMRQEGIRVLEMTQTYLVPLSEDISNRRVRKTSENGSVEYTYTEKRRISKISREEYESVISSEEYSEKLLQAVSFLEKTRYSFPYGGHVIEIDVYPERFGGKALSGCAILEIEMPSEDDDPAIPCFIEVLKEVTGIKKYSNMKLAKRIPRP